VLSLSVETIKILHLSTSLLQKSGALSLGSLQVRLGLDDSDGGVFFGSLGLSFGFGL
jgi:hypothetical protein